MQNQACPACGGEIGFKSRFSQLTVCSYCQTVIHRNHEKLTAEGKVSVLSDDYSVIQIGTTGTFQEIPFEIIGLLQASWDSGFWNEWHAVDTNGQSAWLIEAYGTYSYVRPIDAPSSLPKPEQLSIGESIKLVDQNFTVKDIKSYTCEHILGELPFYIKEGAIGLSIDLASSTANCAYLEKSKTQTRLFMGEYVELDDLQPSGLKDIEDW